MTLHARVFLSVLLVAALGCGQDDTTETETETPTGSTCDENGEEDCLELKTGALGVDEDYDIADIEIEDDRLRVKMADGKGLPPNIKEGGVIFGGKEQSRFAGKGKPFLRKITKVEEDGDSVIVHTEPAALVDAVKRARFTKKSYQPTKGKAWSAHKLPGGKGDAYCKADADCKCPPAAAKGCACRKVPGGAQRCVPLCDADKDCPKLGGEPGVCFVEQGFCAPPKPPARKPGTQTGALEVGVEDCTVSILDNEEIADGVTATVKLSECHFIFEPDLDFSLSIGITGLKTLHLSVGGSLDVLVKALAEISADIDKEQEKEVISYSFPLTFTLGPVPVQIDFVITLYAGYLFTLEGYASFETGYEFTNTVKVGVEYEKGEGWDKIWVANATAKKIGPTIELEADMDTEVWLRPELAVLLYGIAGPTLDFRPYLHFSADVSNKNGMTTTEIAEKPGATGTTKEACWDLYGGFDASVGLYVELLDTELVNKDWNLVAKEFDIAGDCYEFEVPFSETPGGGTLGIGGCKPHQGCMDSDDCETSSACAMAACTDCQCKTVLMFGCCSSDDACDDGNPCTTDSCTNNKCSNSPKTNCCQSDSECDDGETCTKATNQCFKVAGGLPGMPGG